MTQVQARECVEPPEVTTGTGGCFPRVFGGSAALLTPWFWISGLQNYVRINFCCLKCPVWSCEGGPGNECMDPP